MYIQYLLHEVFYVDGNYVFHTCSFKTDIRSRVKEGLHMVAIVVSEHPECGFL